MDDIDAVSVGLARTEIRMVINRGCQPCQLPNPDGLPTCRGCGAEMPPAEVVVEVHESEID